MTSLPAPYPLFLLEEQFGLFFYPRDSPKDLDNQKPFTGDKREGAVVKSLVFFAPHL